MNKLMMLLFLGLALSDCKRKDPEPDAVIEGVVGSWRLIEVEKTMNNEKVWQTVDKDQEMVFTFRFDGVLLDEGGLPFCCAASSYIVNGTGYKVVAKAKIPENPRCAVINCATCDNWEIQQKGDEMITTSCFNLSRAKYIRIKRSGS